MTKYVPTTTQAGDVNELRRYTLGELYRISSSLATVEATGNSVEVVATLPTTGNYEGRVVYLTTDDKLYSHNGTVWSPVAAEFIASGDSIMSYAQATAPTSPNTGDIWFDTANSNQARRYSGTAWVSVADARVAGLLSSLSIETTNRQTADQSLSQSITNLTATVNTNNSTQSAAISTEQTVRANADSALASNITALTATVNTNNSTQSAAITNEQTVRANADSALASNISSLTATVTNNNNTLSAAINNEQQARVDGDEALAQQITQLIVSGGAVIMTYAQATAPANPNIGDIWFDTSTTANTPKRWSGAAWVALADARVAANAAAIVTEQTVRANADSALATNITDLAAVVSSNNSTQSAAISNEQTVRANADTALASSVSTLTATVNTNNSTQSAAITNEQTVRANADSALASNITALTATVNTNNTNANAAITNEQTVRANADSALASNISSLTTTVTNNNNTLTAAINNEQTARADADEALAQQITQLIVSGGAVIMTYAQSTAPSSPSIGDLWFDTSTTANTPKRWSGSAWVSLADARVAVNAAAIVTEQSARISADSALATNITDLSAVVSSNNSTQQSAISNEQTVRANADTALASSISTLTATVNSNNSAQQAAISNEQTARANADTALASSITALTATVNTNNTNTNAAISAEQTARASADTALATRATNLEATVNSSTVGNTALQSRISTEESARASGDATNAASITTLTSTVNGQSANITTLQTTSASLQGDVTNLNAQYGVTVSAGKVTGFKLNSSATTSEFIVQADRFKIENAAGTPFEVIGGTTYLKEAMINTLNASKITTGTLSTSRLNIDGITLTNSGGALQISTGGVNTGQLAGGAVSDINYAIGGGPNLTTSWAVIQTVTISLSQTSTVLLTGATEVGVYMTSAVAAQHGVQMAIIKSGESPSDVTSSIDTATSLNYFRGLSLRRVRVLSAGTHTFQLVAKMTANGTGGSYAYSSNPYLEALVLKR